MSVVGVGVDLVDIERFSRALQRTPALRTRLFSDVEIEGRELTTQSLAARFAAKEAALKALGGHIEGFGWHDIRVDGDPGQPPTLVLSGGVARRASTRGVTSTHLSLSHDGGVAIAFVVLDGQGG